MQQRAGQARAYIVVAKNCATVAVHETRPVEPRSKGGVVMEEDVAMAQLYGGVLAADAPVDDLNGILGKATDGRELLRHREARGSLAGGCREREDESGRHDEPSLTAFARNRIQGVPSTPMWGVTFTARTNILPPPD